MSIEIGRAYENSSRLSVHQNGKEFIWTEIISPSDAEAASLSVVWRTNKGIHTVLNETRTLWLALSNTCETPRHLGRPPKYSYLDSDGENERERRVCLRALESIPRPVIALITNTTIVHLAPGEQNQIFNALEQSWSSLPVLRRREVNNPH